jgi:hypothetical protein
VDPVDCGDGRRQLHGLSLQLAALDAIGCAHEQHTVARSKRGVAG